MSSAVHRVGSRDAPPGLSDDAAIAQSNPGAAAGVKTPKTPKSKASSAKHDWSTENLVASAKQKIAF